jgi:hypothetical protein
MGMNSARRRSACLDVQYSLMKGIRTWAAFEFMITIRPFVFCSSGIAKLHSQDVSALDHRTSVSR